MPEGGDQRTNIFSLLAESEARSESGLKNMPQGPIGRFQWPLLCIHRASIGLRLPVSLLTGGSSV